MFESALEICNDNDKSIIYTALGMVASKFKMDDAITNFFKRQIRKTKFLKKHSYFYSYLHYSFKSQPICIQSLFALCSIGLLKNDSKLITAVFKELNAITDYKYMFDILKLKTIYYCLKVISIFFDELF